MLTELAIENLGVISKSRVEFSPGLTVLTGETGAGKTMVVSSLRLLCGARADASRIRSGSEQAVVEGSFSLADIGEAATTNIQELLSETGAELDDNNELISTRILKANGRSKAHLGGRSVPATALATLSSQLLAIHGQNDQLRLLEADNQIMALDRVDTKIQPLLAAYQSAYRTWKKLKKEVAHRKASRRELALEIDRLEHAIAEIEKINPRNGEDQELVEQIRLLQDVDDLREASTVAAVALDGSSVEGVWASEDSANASDLLAQAEQSLLGSTDPQLQELGTRLGEVISLVSDISQELGSYISNLDSDPQRLEQLLERQHEIKTLTKKYAPDATGVLQWLAKAQQRLQDIDVSPAALEKLEAELQAAQESMSAAATKLSQARKKAASLLSESVTKELHGLAMPKSQFQVQIDTIAPGPLGADQVEFLLAPNQNLPARPLGQTASGGELSRVMLALEVIVSNQGGATLVFDEVDAGVGGRAAVEIGRRLARLARNNQVIVVTHLPQVAAFADAHVHISKHVGDETVSSGVQELDQTERVEELARMLAGLDDTETGRAHAEELLNRAQQEVAQLRG